MVIHPSVLQMARRLVLLPMTAGLSAFAVYLMTLSTSVCPGYSASLASAAAGESPPSNASHPLFSLVARQVASLEVLSLPVRLNLLSAVCGAFGVWLLGLLVGRAILYSGCEDPGGGGVAAPGQGDEDCPASAPGMPPEVDAYNCQVLRTAKAGGVAASLLFAFSVPVWSAATRLDCGLFALTLGLASCCLFPAANEPLRDTKLALSAFFFSLGLFESSAFALALPCYALFLFRTVLLESDRRPAGMAAVALAVLLGAACAVGAFRQNMSDGPSLSPANLLSVYARELGWHHLFELRSFFPEQGWLLVLLQVGLPAAVLTFGLPTLLRDRTAGMAVAAALSAVFVSPSLMNLPVAPYRIGEMIGRLPVFSSAISAAGAATVLAACLLVLRGTAQGRDDPEEQADAEEAGMRMRLRWFCGGLLAALLLVCVVSLGLNRRAVDNGRGAFADRVAHAMLGEMRGRTCLITNGLIDNHLRVQARMLGQPLTLITLRARPIARETEALRRLIADSALFDGLNRVRLQNALSISVVRFVMEWFNTDPRAADKAALFASPDIWTACGYRAYPEGIAFVGMKGKGSPDLKVLEERNRAFVARTAPALAGVAGGDRQTEGLRMALRMRVGFAANELGTALEDAGEWEAAYASYQRATSVDPRNVSAAVNSYALVRTRRLHPEAEDALKLRMQKAVAAAGLRSMQDITWLLQNNGSIRQQAFFQQQTAVWSSLGSRAVAADKVRKAQSLSVKTGAALLIDNAATYLQAGDVARAEACYTAVLGQDGESRDALIGLCTLAIGQKRVGEADNWYRKALAGGVEAPALRYQAVMLALLKGERERALKLLEAATKEVPADSRYWALLADQLLERGDFQYVERQLLPDMQQALRSTDHYLVHAVRGLALRRKGPAFYREARNSLLQAVARNASLTEIWSALLKLDMEIGSPDLTESDARKLLGSDPDNPVGNYLLGSILLARNALVEAEDFLRRSVEQRPTASAYNDLAEALRRQKRLPEAEVFARKALELQPDLATAMDTLACVLYDDGRYDESAASAERAVGARPRCAAFQLSLLRAQVKRGKREAVVRLLYELREQETAVPESLQKAINAMP